MHSLVLYTCHRLYMDLIDIVQHLQVQFKKRTNDISDKLQNILNKGLNNVGSSLMNV